MPAITNHPAFSQPPDPAVPIWRYMDFAKYVAMLRTRALHFARVDQLGDPFEGSPSRDEYEHLQAVARDGEENRKIPEEWHGKYFDKYIVGIWRRARKINYVNCWHMNRSESEAMWRLYSTSGGAIAIRSDYQTLVNSLPSDLHNGCFVGAVSYVDHHTESMPRGNGFTYVTHKRKAFAHEHECRAIVWCNDPGPEREAELENRPMGLEVPVDLNKLVRGVVISPSAPGWFTDTVQETSQKFGLSFPVTTSELSLPPYI